MKAPQRIRLGDLLVENKIISEAQLTSALESQKSTGRKLGKVLIEHGYVKEDVMCIGSSVADGLCCPGCHCLVFRHPERRGYLRPG